MNDEPSSIITAAPLAAERCVEEWAPAGWFAEYKDFAILCAICCPARRTGEIMKHLAEKFPMHKKWNHLKRAKKAADGSVQIIVTEKKDDLTEEQRSFLKSLVASSAAEPCTDPALDNCLVDVTVPAAPPRTLDEVRLLSESVWPLVFRKSQLAWTPTPLSVSDKQLAYQRGEQLFAMPSPLPEAAWYSKSRIPFCSLRCALYMSGTLVAQADNTAMFGCCNPYAPNANPAIPMPPHSPKAASSSAQVSGCNPIRHAIMEALRVLSVQVKEASVAKKIRRGSPSTTTASTSEGSPSVDDLEPGSAPTLTTINSSRCSSQTDLPAASSPSGLEDCQRRHSRDVGEMLDDTRSSDDHSDPIKSSQYYASGCDVYLVGEPCLMCSMALVHSRTTRVFVCTKLGKKQAADSSPESDQSSPVPIDSSSTSTFKGSGLSLVSPHRNPLLAAYCTGGEFRNIWTGGFGSISDTLAVQWARPLNHHYRVYVVRILGENEPDREPCRSIEVGSPAA